MCENKQNAKQLRDLVEHLEKAAELLDGRLEIFNSRLGEELIGVAAEAHTDLCYACNYITQAIGCLRPLVH